MAIKQISKCASCGYPIAAEYEGQLVTCPMCQSVNQAITGVTIPDPLFWGSLGILAGLILAKSKWAARQIGRI